MAATSLPAAQSLRILSIDGGGIKGYSSLLILRRIIRSLVSEGNLAHEPRPCEVFDLIAGTSTGGLIAVMLGRLHMTVDECIAAYEEVGRKIFGGGGPAGGQVGKLVKGLTSSAFYDVETLQEEVKKVLDMRGLPRNEAFLEEKPMCKVMLCVTRKATSKADVLRNYKSLHPTEENYNCYIWEAASATAAAPMYFRRVKFEQSGEKWSDGGMRRNNPINEALAETVREREWEHRTVGCIVSLGTGVPQMKAVSANLATFLRRSVEIMTDSEDTASQFAASKDGRELAKSRRYFRFSVPYGMSEIRMEDYKETEKMSALTVDYLRSVGSGDQVESCAKSLLHPDENIQIGIQYKPCMLPYNPCTHFIERPRYAQRLHSFFTPQLQRQQIFVLWGLGGIGKTQIALKFAHDIKHRLSVFWIRGDNFMNFAADYAGISHHLEPIPEVDLYTDETNPTEKLSRTLRILQHSAQNWLIILDNADDLDQFRDKSSQAMCIADFLPRNGRLLITTRDERFVGAVSKAQDAQRVSPMDASEAKDLIITSIPPDMVQINHPATQRAVTELLDELGNLPLAIAQAAANIHDRRSNLIDYVILYREKKRRMALMKEPVWDFQDPNSSTRSIHITWEISFEHLKDKSPLSALCLSYLGCFHCRKIPQSLILCLPEFQSMDPDEFQQVMKQLLRLALVDRMEESDEVVEYGVHPLVHERVMSRLPTEEATQYLSTCSNIMVTFFPLLVNVQDSSFDAQIAQYLVAHALRQIELGEELSFTSKSIARLTQCVASFVSAIGMAKFGVHLATRAADMAPLVWDRQSSSILYVTKTFCSALNNAAMYKEAEEQCRVALDCGLEIAKGSLSEDELEEERGQLESELGIALMGLKNYDELVVLRKSQLQNKSVIGSPTKEVVVKHNLAHALHHVGQNESAKQINDELLAWSDTTEGKEAIPPSLRLIMMNLRLLISEAAHLKSSRPEKAVQEDILRTRELIYQQSRNLGGITDIDTWKAMNNLLGELLRSDKIDEARGVLQEILQACCSITLTIEGQLAETFSISYGGCVDVISRLDRRNRPADANQLQKLLNDCVEHVGIDFISASWSEKDYTLNTYGVNLQHNGRFAEAETCHRNALEIYETYGKSCAVESPLASEQVGLLHIIYYNIMLAVARQGRVAEAMSFREKHMREIARAEAVYGNLTDRLKRDQNEKRIYDEASSGLRQGTIRRGDRWWTDNQGTLGKAERRYGNLAQNATPEELRTTITINETKPHHFKRWLFLPMRKREARQP